jgi:hypothetical protein
MNELIEDHISRYKSQRMTDPSVQIVLNRDNFTCQACGANDADVGGRKHMRVCYVVRNDTCVENSLHNLSLQPTLAG